MPPPRITQKFIENQSDAFIKDLHRAISLYEKICMNGYVLANDGIATRKISQPDSRDMTQFIFFEIAAKFEDFAKVMFQSEVRFLLKVTRAQADFVMGDADNGMNGKMGWGTPAMLTQRGKNLFGAESFFGALGNHIGPAAYKALMDAHTVRNRLAHSGGSAQTKFVKLLEGCGIPINERQGMAVGRFLKDYPKKKPSGEKNFHAYIAAYEMFAAKAKAELISPPA